MGTIHSTKNSSLNFWNFPVAKGTVFSTWLNRSCQNGGFAIRFVCYSSTISSNQTFLILRSNDEMILPVNLFLTRGKFTRSYIYDYFGLNFLRHLPVRPLYDLFSVTIWLRDIALDKIKKFLFQELNETSRRVTGIEMCHGNYSMLCETKKHTYGWWIGRNGVIMPNGTGNSWNFQNEFPETFCSIQFCTGISGNFGPMPIVPSISWCLKGICFQSLTWHITWKIGRIVLSLLQIATAPFLFTQHLQSHW